MIDDPFVQKAARLVAENIAVERLKDRPELLTQIIRQAVAGLIVINGDRDTANVLYRLADKVATEGRP